MPPHAEETTMVMDYTSSSIPEAPKKNVTTAFNYAISLVDEFVSSNSSGRKPRRMYGDSVLGAGENPPIISDSSTEEVNGETSSSSWKRKDSNVENHQNNQSDTASIVLSPDSRRRSGRDRQGKRDVAYARNPVRYDMQMVPLVRKNKAFLRQFPTWWMTTEAERKDNSTPGTRRSSRLAVLPPETRKDKTTTTTTEQLPAPSDPTTPATISPFVDDSSVIWIPTKRSEWEDSVSEMTAVCTSAGLHRYHQAQECADTEFPPKRMFQPPLSRDYIRDRVDIDDPLRGYQVRHAKGGWLQGFLLWTNFTTWTHYFKWDSLHPQSGVGLTGGGNMDRPADRDGTLAQELEACTRSGDPLVGGIVFPEIAEIALVGGLGCGEYLLRMALDDIRAAGTYKYVLLQATNESKSFYERFGFVRVGAICRYFNSNLTNDKDDSLVGYRHWTHPNESDASLQLHGGPSYMMCLKLPTSCAETDDGANWWENSFRAHMERLATTDRKPTIGQLGGTSLPSYWRSNSSSATTMSSSQVNVTPKRKPGRRPSMKPSPAGKKPITQVISQNGLPLPLPPVAKRRFSNKAPPKEPAPKRRRLSNDGGSAGSGALITAKPEVGSKSNRSKTKKAPQTPERPNYHSIRGNDGRFIRVLVDGTTVSPPSNKSKPATNSKPSWPPTTIKKKAKSKGPKRINRAELKKQKVKAYPRDRVHFYNRVVKPKTGKKDYFFVLHYDENAGLIRTVPMHVTGICLGRHAGRPRYQCSIGDTDVNFRTDKASKYEVVAATMVMKTSIVASEAWDIQDN